MSALDFIGLGVEKSGTSWIFACLYEHPEVCIPVKELNYFLEDKTRELTETDYKLFFKDRCPNGKIRGEFSTSYFYQKEVAQRIHSIYPDIKLIVCLRDPIDRAYSNYLNDIKAGTIKHDLSFEAAMKTNRYYLDQGRYKEQFKRYFTFFKKEQLKIVLYKDLVENPLIFIQSIYRFIGVDDQFVPPSINKRINAGRIPSNVEVEKLSNSIAAFLQQSKFGEKIWWLIKKSRIPEVLRIFNTRSKTDKFIDPKLKKS